MSEVLTTRGGAVLTITLNRPDVFNAFNRALHDALRSALEEAAEPAVRAVVITGAGRGFSAGQDLREFSALQESLEDALEATYHPNIRLIRGLAKPVIAAVNGPAFGGGFLLAQMCDLCVAGASAQFAITEARWGRGAPWAAPLRWLVPPRVAMELLLTGDPIDAQRAYEVGLVNRVVPDPELRSEAGRLARRIAGNAPLSVRAAKAMVQASAGRDLDEAVEEGWRLFEPVYLSEDAQEGPRAFVERRPPVWKGR
jgi:enoyl-CoA hydratase/carnithine racemase